MLLRCHLPQLLRVALAAGLLLLLHHLWTPEISYRLGLTGGWSKILRSYHDCPQISGLDDVLVVLKTGASESHAKVPEQLSSSLRCVPHLVIYSDLNENIGGHRVHDVLDEVDEHIRRTNPDFRVYNELQRLGRAETTPDNLDSLPSSKKPGFGKPENPYWALDKWKFLPMVDRALRHRPDAKWYVFMEADTYLLWPSLLQWLSRFNASQPHFLGEQMQIHNTIFAYGGSGFIISGPAMHRVVEDRRSHLQEYNNVTEKTWAGDAVLGWAMKTSGVPLLWSWPSLQGHPPQELDYARNAYFRQLWCHPAVSYHHMSIEQIRSLWQFQQEWERKNSRPPTHGDVFRAFILPQIRAAPDRDDWDNMSEVTESDPSASTFRTCRAACQRSPQCRQFSYSSDGECRTSASIRLGYLNSTATSLGFVSGVSAGTDGPRPRNRVTCQSGWMVDRIDAFMDDVENDCTGDGWIL